MPINILVVVPGEEFISRLAAILSPHAAELSLCFVNNRKEALVALEKSSFQQIVTALRIPGVSDGYRFLSQIVNKVLEGKKIIALVEQKTHGIEAGITSIGLEHIYAADDLQGIAQAILQNSGLLEPPVDESGSLPEVMAEEEQIRSALNQVMGPVGTLIFHNALKLCKKQGDTAELVRLIAAEIGAENQINQFYARLQ